MRVGRGGTHASGDETGSPNGPGEAGPGNGGPGSGRDTTGKGKGHSTILNDGPLEAATEPRMSVESALSDPKPFLDGSSRVTISGDLLFSFDEDTLRPEAESKLRQVAKLLRLDPSVKVLLEGHSDTIGGDQYNQELSERRATAVRAWLVEQAHINPGQVETVGFGASRPIVPSSKSPNEQAPNRRVEVRVLGP
jgi:outer membrane protein OmpA-like peptidoglycan-associated protein